MRLCALIFLRGIMSEMPLKLCGIVCEYNPFHSGHRLHLNRAKELSGCDALVCVMSGNFVQRGEPAILDKFTRAAEAVHQGAALVIELPAAFCLSAAPDFAYYAVKLLDQMGVQSICFGSECGELTALQAVANDRTLHSNLKTELDAGISFAQAACNHPLLQAPNNILAVEYLRALHELKSSITPFTIKRQGNYHSDCVDTPYASASAIRADRKNNYENSTTYLSRNCLEELRCAVLPDLEKFFALLKYKLCTSLPQQLEQINGITEGLQNRLIRSAANSNCFEEFWERISSKRYPSGRLRRILVNTLLDIDKKTVFNSKYIPGYFKVLAVSHDFLRNLKYFETALLMTNEDLNKISNQTEKELLRIDSTASLLYGLLTGKSCPDLLSHPQIMEP